MSERCTGTYKPAEPHDYATLRCKRCNHGYKREHTYLEAKPGDQCIRVPSVRHRSQRPTIEEQSEHYRNNMNGAGRGHLLP